MSAKEMVIINDILYLSSQYLHKFGFTDTFLWTKTKEFRQGISNNYNNVKGIDPENKSQKEVLLISYDSIPEQTRLDKGMPSKEQLLARVREREVCKLVHFNTEAYNYYLTQPATAKSAKHKAEQASWLIAIASARPNQVKALGFSNKDEFGLAAIRLMNEQATKSGWLSWKCTSLQELRKRITPFNKFLKGTITLAEACGNRISKKVGNTNASKIGYDQMASLVQIYSDANSKPNFEQTWSIYTRKAKEMIRLGHWTEDILISDSAVRMFLSKPSIRQMWYEARHGYQPYRNEFEPVTQRERPSFANALWVIDGTPSHRYFQHGEKGRYFRFNIFPILDAHSWCVLGFWLSETENTDAVLGALRSACWVSGHMPHQILYDNSSAIQSYRAQEAIDKISVVNFAATAGNARSKIIENFFHRFNEDVQKFRPGYTANPFALSLNNRPNREALARMVKANELPLAENAIKQAIADLTIWNNTPRKFLGGLSPIDAYRKSVAATMNKQRKFSHVIDVEAFWELPGEQKKIRTYEEGKQKLVNTFVPQSYEFTNYGIEIVIAGKKLFYDIEDPDFRRLYIGQRFTVKYEGNTERWVNGQPDQLLLYLNGAPMQWRDEHVAALPKEVIPMAVADHVEGTRTTLNERMKNKKNQRSVVQQNFQALIDHTKKTGTYTEVITDNAFDKEVLNDSREQRLNAMMEGDNWMTTEPKKVAKKIKATEKKPSLDRYGEQYDDKTQL